MFTRIVVPLDGSALAERALMYAGALARMGNIPIQLIRVFDLSPVEHYGPYAFAVSRSEFDRAIQEERANVDEYLAAIAKQLGDTGLGVTRVALRGIPSHVLVECLYPADLIIMTSHGRGGPARWFLGSVTEEVVRRSPVPVLVIKESIDQPMRDDNVANQSVTQDEKPRTFDRIVLALDGSAIAEQACAPAETLARLTGSPLHLIRIVDLKPIQRVDTVALSLLGPYPDEFVADEKKAAQQYMDRIQQRLARTGIPVTTETQIGEVPPEILRTLVPGDILVIASHGRGGITRWLLGSVAESVMRRSPVPVLLVRASTDSTFPAEALVKP